MNGRAILALFALSLAGSAAAQALSPDGPRVRQPPLAHYASLPLQFEQIPGNDGETTFTARTAGYGLSVSRQGATLAFRDASPVNIRFIHASADARVRGIGPESTRIHRLRFDRARDAIDAPAYERIAISNLQPGMDIAFRGRGRELEYDVVVAPGADPSRFAFRIEGSESVALDDGDDLAIATAAGTLTIKAPVAYQDIAGARRSVASAFAMDDDGVVRIRVGDYDTTKTLIIDPIVSYATYVAGSNYEQATAIAVDGTGNAYITGYTQSTDFPLLNAYDRSLGRKGDVDVFVSKLNAEGTGLVWSTYVGGASVDRAVGIAVDASGSAYVTGLTSGTDFPTTANGWQKGIAGGGGFVVKLAPAGNALIFSTYIAASNPSAIAVDSAGNAFVTGSASRSFVTTPGALQTTTASVSGSTAFLLKLNAAGTAPVFATFLGGSGGEDATSLALDNGGNAYVGGWTTSTDFPVRNAYQASKRSAKDGFVAKIAGDGSQIVYATLLGGSLDDAVNAIAVDRAGSAYVAGETYSGDFPVISGFQMQKAGRLLIGSSLGNAFVAKLGPGGNSLVYASFLGGEVCQAPCQSVFGVPQIPGDAAYGIAVDSTGHAYVTGFASSWTFPLVDSPSWPKQQDNQNSAFAAKVAASGTSLLWSTFVRTGFDPGATATRFPAGSATGVAIDATDAAFVTGLANDSSGFTATPGAFQTSSVDPGAIVVKFRPMPTITLSTSNATADTSTPITLTATMSGGTLGNAVFMDGSTRIGGSAQFVDGQASLTLTLTAGIHALSAMLFVAGSMNDSAPITQVVDVPLVCN
ncbi:MAG TPA: SBBP repeat-containing protein [Casimicrobiaceae bacterium]